MSDEKTFVCDVCGIGLPLEDRTIRHDLKEPEAMLTLALCPACCERPTPDWYRAQVREERYLSLCRDESMEIANRTAVTEEFVYRLLTEGMMNVEVVELLARMSLYGYSVEQILAMVNAVRAPGLEPLV